MNSRRQQHSQRRQITNPLLISMLVAGWTCMADAADPDAVLERMRELLGRDKSRELTVAFAHEGFSAWPTGDHQMTLRKTRKVS